MWHQPTQRPATHAGSWYSAEPKALAAQIISSLTRNVVPGTRIIVAPHAGYTYSIERLGEAFGVLDISNLKRIFILGPSHHVYFRNHVMISNYHLYRTPFGLMNIDIAVCQELSTYKEFQYMSQEIDKNEHSFEMHMPFIAQRFAQIQRLHDVLIVPLMTSALDEKSANRIIDKLMPYFEDPSNGFIISSDFCHWGPRFGYTKYCPYDFELLVFEFDPETDDGIEFLETGPDLESLTSMSQISLPIYKSIANLDKLAMSIARKVDPDHWHEFIKFSGNTICGEKAIWIVLKLLEREGLNKGFKWIGYSQSSRVENHFESSVSYASGYI